MKLSTPVILLTCAIAAPVGAQQTVAEVTEAQITEYKRSAAAGCQEGGKKKGDPQAMVDAFCGCLIDTLNKNMTPNEWRQVVLYSLNKQAEAEVKVLTPHLARVKACLPQ